ncbi:uncharacterized protein LOC106637626 [Copidosoma floridanum]|uniref:uncharacterized protein LOC106637626 n=1 Tax=Copidosoma floridanum TaxID=29053 RepID=UPI0006C95C62|nr:uncharacterized protein LOC106637626 [Copidosoma floridanum]
MQTENYTTATKMKFIINVFVVIACLVHMALSESTPFKKCSIGKPPQDFVIQGCTEEPCILVRNRMASANISFIVDKYTTVLTPQVEVSMPEVRGHIWKISQPENNGCVMLSRNETCPLKAGTKSTLTYHAFVKLPHRKAKKLVNLRFSLLDQDNEVLTCCQIAVKITR